MAFVDMPKPVEKVMCALFAPEFDVSLEEIEDALNILNHIQDEMKEDDRGKVLQSLISVISQGAVADEIRQTIMKNLQQSMNQKHDLAENVINLVKDVTENKDHPLLCQPVISGNIQSSNSLRSKNKSLSLPSYWNNISANISDVGSSHMMEQLAQRSTGFKAGQDSKNHSLLIPGCSKSPLSRMTYKQEHTGITLNSGTFHASVGEQCYPEKLNIAEGWTRTGQFTEGEYSCNDLGNGSKMASQCKETTPVEGMRSIDKYYCMEEMVTPLSSSKKESHETKNEQKGVLSGTKKYPQTNVVLRKVGSNCIMVAVKDKTNRFILPKPENSIPMNKDNTKHVLKSSKGVPAKNKARKRCGIDVMALCSGHKVGKTSIGKSRFPTGQACGMKIRSVVEPTTTNLQCLKDARKCESVQYLKQGQATWKNDLEKFSPLLQNGDQKIDKGLSETVCVESAAGKEEYEMIASPSHCGLRSGSLNKTAIKGEEVDSLMSMSNEETLMQLLHVDNLKTGDIVVKNKTIVSPGPIIITEDEEEDADVLIIDEDPPVVVDSDCNDLKTKDGQKSGFSTDAKTVYKTFNSKDMCWISAGQDQDHYRDHHEEEHCWDLAKGSTGTGHGKAVKHQGQISPSYLKFELSTWARPYMMHVVNAPSNSEFDFKETESQSNASDTSSPEASSSADSLCLSQSSDGGSLETPELPEYSFLVNLLKCHDEMKSKNNLSNFSCKKILPRKKAKPRRSRRTRRARAASQN